MSARWIRPLFVLAGVYDGVLGIAYLLFTGAIFQRFGVTPPNHPAYVQFPALLLILFAVIFFRIATDPVRHRESMLYGAGLKAAYSGLAFWYQLTRGIPSMWVPLAWVDLAFLVLFLVAWRSVGEGAPASETLRTAARA